MLALTLTSLGGWSISLRARGFGSDVLGMSKWGDCNLLPIIYDCLVLSIASLSQYLRDPTQYM